MGKTITEGIEPLDRAANLFSFVADKRLSKGKTRDQTLLKLRNKNTVGLIGNDIPVGVVSLAGNTVANISPSFQCILSQWSLRFHRNI